MFHIAEFKTAAARIIPGFFSDSYRHLLFLHTPSQRIRNAHLSKIHSPVNSLSLVLTIHLPYLQKFTKKVALEK